MAWRFSALLSMLVGCGQVIGIRELGVEAQSPGISGDDGGPSADSGAVPTDAAEAGPCSASDVAGHWSGSVTGFNGNVISLLSGEADFQQQCTVITGSLIINNCMPRGRVSATIDDIGALDGTVTSAGVVITVKASLSGPNQLQGEFTIPSNTNCYVPRATFRFDRK